MKELVKIVVFVPEENADKMRQALGAAGAGKIGEYSFCSFSIKGTGRFKPSDKANPHTGTAGKMEATDEERIEVACEKAQATEIIKTIKNVPLRRSCDRYLSDAFIVVLHQGIYEQRTRLVQQPG
ncbi:MAG: hypothetical protein U0524_02795 [Candidatus Saccharimonadales bacterium]